MKYCCETARERNSPSLSLSSALQSAVDLVFSPRVSLSKCKPPCVSPRANGILGIIIAPREFSDKRYLHRSETRSMIRSSQGGDRKREKKNRESRTISHARRTRERERQEGRQTGNSGPESSDLIHRRRDLRACVWSAGRFVGGRTTSVPQTQRDKANPRGVGQATSDHRADIHEQQPCQCFYSPSPLPLFSSLSFTFSTVEQPVVRRRQSIYRPSTETRRYVEHT